MIGILIYRLMLAKAHIKHLLLRTLAIYLLITVILLVLGLFGIFELLTTVLPFILIFVCAAIIFSYSFAKTLSILPEIGGSASAALGSLFSIISGLSSGGASFLEASSLVPIALAYLCLVVLSFIIYRAFLHFNRAA